MENVTFGGFWALAKTGGPGPPLRKFREVGFEVHFGSIFEAFGWLCWGLGGGFCGVAAGLGGFWERLPKLR